MEGKNLQELTEKSKVFQIPIEDFEDDMNTESSKEKKKEILELLKTYNKLRSEKEFDEIKNDLHEACREGDLRIIKIFLSKTIKDSTNTLKFKIDETNQTASLFKVENEVDELIIPRTVEYESTEYLITSIINTCHDVKTVKFSKDSAVKTFYKHTFSFPIIEEIYFPSSLKELKEGWFDRTKYLKKIIISPSNNQFEFKEDKYLVCKSEEYNNEFDKLLFVRRDIKEFSIPSNIKIISSCAFDFSNIESIFISSSVTKICKSAFSHCEKLQKVEIPTNSNLQTIESNAFSSSNIESIYLPSSLKELKEGWCCKTKYLKKIIISPSNNQFEFKEDKYLVCKSEENKNEFDKLLFVRRDIKEFSIPSNIKIISSCAFDFSNIESIFIPSSVTKICKSAFSHCEKLQKVEIPTNSNLQTIESNAFSSSNIEFIYIPPKVSKISESTFSFCQNLKKVEIPTNSNLQTIESNAFTYSNIESILIPSKVSKICEYAFSCCQNLKKVEIPTKSNLQVIESHAFSSSNIESIYFPASLKELKERWYCETTNLKKIIISPLNNHFKFKEDKYLVCKSESKTDKFDNILFVRRDVETFSIPSNIKIISSYAFSNSNIKSIFIPSNVSKICFSAFSKCKNLIKVEIPPNSNLQKIESYAFSNSNIESIYIPSKVLKICDSAFSCCENLKKVEIPTNSNLQKIESHAFFNSNIQSIFIPSKVSKLCESAFSFCQFLQIIEISEESELVSLSFLVFRRCQQIIIMIPASLRKLNISIN